MAEQQPDGTDSAAVVVLHGFAGVPGMMTPLSRALRKRGLRVFEPWYDSWSLPLAAIVDRLAGPVAAFARELSPDAPLHFAGHSMGGLVARALIARARPARLGRVVMLGTPSHGSELADLLHRWPMTRPVLGRAAPALLTAGDPAVAAALGAVDYPLGIVAGNRSLLPAVSNRILPAPHDGKVSVASTHVAGEADHIVLPLGHMMLAWHRAAHAQTAAFLTTGAFDHNTA